MKILFACIAIIAVGWAQPKWDDLKDAYKYDPKLDLKVEVGDKDDSEAFHQHVTFTNAKGEKVTGLFLRPKGDLKYPCALLLHGLTSRKEMMINMYGRRLARAGFAVLALDAPNHGERQSGSRSLGVAAMGDMIQGGVLDYRQALEYLKTRKDVDNDRIGLLGYSMGAMMGAILAGVDDRVKASVLCVGGDVVQSMIATLPEELRARAQFVSPANYAGHISPRPVLFINGKNDNVVNEAAAKRLHEAAKPPKEIVWADAAHLLGEADNKKAIDWLVDKLGRK